MLSLQVTPITLILDMCASQLQGNYWRPHHCLDITAGMEEACVVVAALLYGRHLVWGLPSAIIKSYTRNLRRPQPDSWR